MLNADNLEIEIGFKDSVRKRMRIAWKKMMVSAVSVIAGVLPVAAQSHLDASVSVEGKYLPEIIRMERVSPYPKGFTTEIPFSGLDYSLRGVTASFLPDGTPITPLVGSIYTSGPQRGYVDLSLGSWLNSNLSAGCAILRNETTSLSARLQFNSTSLWKEKDLPLTRSLGESDTRQRYDGVMGLDFSHKFSATRWLSADLQYHLGAFNYYGLGESQTLNDVAFRAAWNSMQGLDALNWNVGAGVHYFGYRSGGYISDKGTRETGVNINGALSMPWSNGSTISLDADFDLLCYAGNGDPYPMTKGSQNYNALNRSNFYSLVPDNYGLLTLTPAYTFAKGRTNIRVGADVDLSFNAGENGNHYNLFHIAPDCRVMTDFGQVRLALDVKGGSELTTLASLYNIDYYQSPVLLTTRPVYTPVDARLEVSFGPFGGFSVSAWGEYKISRGVYLGGGYLAGLTLVGDYEGARMNLHGFSTGLRMNWKPSRVFGFDAYGSYQNQRGTLGFFNGYDRPKFVAGASVDLVPVKQLGININYELRALRSFYSPEARRLPNLSLLGANVKFNVTDNLYLGVSGCNLLNRRNILTPNNPSDGITVLGNLGFVF